MKLRYLVCLALLVHGNDVNALEIDDVLALEDSTVYIADAEFDYNTNNRLLWHGVEGRLWLAWINPSASIMPGDGRGRLLDTEVIPPQTYGNGAEFVHGGGETYIVYNNLTQEVVALKQEADLWVPVDLGDTQNSLVPLGTPPGSPIARISFYSVSPGGFILELHSRDLVNNESTLIMPEGRNARWFDGDHFVTTVPESGELQAALVDYNTGERTVMTNNPGAKNFARIMYCPDLGVNVLFCTGDWRTLEMWVPDGTQWTLIKSLTTPNPLRRTMRDPEPFVYKGKSYIAFVGSKTREFEVGNDSDIWLTQVDPNSDWVRRVSRDNIEGRFLIDPEVFVAQDDVYLFYGELSFNPQFPNGWYTTRRAGTGLDEVVPVEPGGGTPSLDGRITAWPLPFSGGELNITFPTVHNGAPVHTQIAVYDVAGRRIRVLAQGVFRASPHQIQWDGRDEQGNLLASGVYFLRTSGKVSPRTLKVVIVR